jgi:hypothetical protein
MAGTAEMADVAATASQGVMEQQVVEEPAELLSLSRPW